MKYRKRTALTSGFFWAGALIMVLLLVGFADLFSKKRQVDLEIERTKGEIQELATTNGDILEFVEYLNSEGFVEEEARKKFNLALPGEKVVVITDGKNEKENAPETQQNAMETNPQKWWKYFFQ